jgi:hypothetical protein
MSDARCAMRDSSRSCFSSFLLPARSGHSERRGEFGLPTPAESNELLATKCAYALEKGLKVVFAIGEPLPIREKGVDAVLAECIKQLEGVKGLLDPAKVVIAYEPVWAIGTGVTASPDQAQETHKAIREWIAKECGASVAEGIRIQYGGSANAKNAPGECLLDAQLLDHPQRATATCRVGRIPCAAAARSRDQCGRGTRARVADSSVPHLSPSSPRSALSFGSLFPLAAAQSSRRCPTSTASLWAAPRSSPSSPRSSPPSRRPSKPQSKPL